MKKTIAWAVMVALVLIILDVLLWSTADYLSLQVGQTQVEYVPASGDSLTFEVSEECVDLHEIYEEYKEERNSSLHYEEIRRRTSEDGVMIIPPGR